MAKQAILRVGVEADPSGLGSVRGQVARGLNTMASQFGQVRGMMQAAMALPAIGMLQNIMQARQEARDMAKDLMAPFSQALASTSESAPATAPWCGPDRTHRRGTSLQ